MKEIEFGQTGEWLAMGELGYIEAAIKYARLYYGSRDDQKEFTVRVRDTENRDLVHAFRMRRDIVFTCTNQRLNSDKTTPVSETCNAT